MNWDAIILAIITGLPATLVAAATLIQSIRTHKAVNSRMTEMIDLTKTSSKAEGVVEEKAAEADRKATK